MILLSTVVLSNKEENRSRGEVSRRKIAPKVYVFNETSIIYEGVCSIQLVQMRSTHANMISEFRETA